METKIINGETYTKVAGGWQKQRKAPVAPQRSFFEEAVPVAGSIGGAVLGGIAGAPLGPAGVVAGGIAGAGVGGAAGGATQQRIEKGYGQRDEMNASQILGTGATSAVLQGTGVAALKGLGMAANAVRPVAVKTLKFLSGYADDAIEAALKRTPGAVETMKQGEVALNDIIKRSASKLQDFASEAVKESRKAVAEFDKLSGGGAGSGGVRRDFLKEGSQFVSNTTRALRSKYNIGVSSNGLLNFDRSVLPSNIVSGGDKGAIQSAFDAVRNITKDTSVKQLDAVTERLIVLKTKTPAGTPTGGETKQIIGGMMDEVLQFAESLGTYGGKGYADWAKFAKQNVVKRSMIDDMKELFGSSRNLSPKEVSQISQKLLNLYNTGKLEIREAAQTLGEKIGEDITGGAAGTIVKTGKQVNTTAGIPTARGLIEKAVEVLPRTGLKNYIATGKITGEIANHPTLLKISQALGVSVKALLQDIAALMEDKTTR